MPITNEEKIMLSSAMVSIGRNIEALLPSTMKYAMVTIFENDDPHLIYSGELRSQQVAKALRAVADRLDPPPVRKVK